MWATQVTRLSARIVAGNSQGSFSKKFSSSPEVSEGGMSV